MTSRSRSSGSITSKSYVETSYQTSKSTCLGSMTKSVLGSHSAVDYFGSRKTMTDEVVPNFRKRSAQGEVFMNRMSSSHVEISEAVFSTAPLIYSNSTMQCVGTGGEYQSIYEFGPTHPLSLTGNNFQPVNGFWTSRPLLSNGEIENALDEASTRCQSERGRSQVTFWETLGERKQSYVLLHSYLQAVSQATKGMYLDVLDKRKGSPFGKFAKSASMITKGAAGVWLITRYGLLPLMSDIQSLMTQLKKDLDVSERHTARGKAVVGRSITSSFKLPHGSCNCEGGILYTDELIVRAMSLDEWRYGLADHFGLGTKDLLTVPWELLTLSFVADWFVNIGDFIGAMIPSPGLNQLGTCISYQRVRSTTVTVSGYSPNGIGVVYSSPTMSKTGVVTEKIRFPGLRAPTILRLNRSKVDPALEKNSYRIVDAAALIGQRIALISDHIQRNPRFK